MQQFTVTAAGYTGTLAASSTCSGIATVSPTSANGPSAIFNVTSVSAGTCIVTFTEAGGRTVSAGVTVTTLGVIIQKKSEHR